MVVVVADRSPRDRPQDHADVAGVRAVFGIAHRHPRRLYGDDFHRTHFLHLINLTGRIHIRTVHRTVGGAAREKRRRESCAKGEFGFHNEFLFRGGVSPRLYFGNAVNLAQSPSACPTKCVF